MKSLHRALLETVVSSSAAEESSLDLWTRHMATVVLPLNLLFLLCKSNKLKRFVSIKVRNGKGDDGTAGTEVEKIGRAISWNYG